MPEKRNQEEQQPQQKRRISGDTSGGIHPPPLYPPPYVEKDPRVDMAITLLRTATELLEQLSRPIWNKPTFPEPPGPGPMPFGADSNPE